LKEERALAEANKRMRLEIATLKSYTRIEKIAEEELGMGKPRPDQVIVIR
jgi:cell division protein FtsL